MEINVRLKRFDEIRQSIDLMIKRAIDLKPVWEKFVPFYIENVIQKNWELKGKLMGKRWKGLSPLYKQMKKRSIGGRGGADLVYSGRLQAAAFGGPGWYQKIDNETLAIGIQGIEYAGIHQFGGDYNVPITPRMRAFFWAMLKETGIEAWKWMALTKKTAFRMTMPQRPYFASFDAGMPGIAEQYLIDLLTDRLIGVAS